MNISVNLFGKRVLVNVRRAEFFSKFFGLMFKSKNTENLLFEFKNDVKISFHSFFVFFSFLIIWLNPKNDVIEWRIVKPFSF